MLTLRWLAEGFVGLGLGGAAWLLVSGAKDVGAPSPAPSPPESAAVEPALRSEEPLREHADDVVDYTLSAVLDVPGHMVHGEGTIVWRNRSSAPVRELWVHLYLNAFKNERTAFLRAPVASGRGTAPV